MPTGANVRPKVDWLSGFGRVACSDLGVLGGASMVSSVGTRVSISSTALSLSIVTFDL